MNSSESRLDLLKVEIDNVDAHLILEMRVHQVDLEHAQEALDTRDRNVEVTINHLLESVFTTVAEYGCDDFNCLIKRKEYLFVYLFFVRRVISHLFSDYFDIDHLFDAYAV